MAHSQVASPSTIGDIDYLHSIAPGLNAYVPTDASDDTVFFLENTYKHLPPDGQHNLASNIDGCRSDGELRQIAKTIDIDLLRPLKALSEKTPKFGVEDSLGNPLNI